MGDRRDFLRAGIAAAGGGPLPGRVQASAGPPPAPKVDARGPVLGPLLAANRTRDPGGRGSNHLSMAVLSLAALGGPSERVRSFGEESLRSQRPFPAGGPAVTARSWRDHLGHTDALPGLRAVFTGEITRIGVAGALREFLPALLPGIGAHAFHAVIRTAYGVRFDDPAEVAIGLAYWAAYFLPLGALATPGTSTDPAVGLAAVRATAGLVKARPPGGLNIAGKMEWAATLPGFASAASALRVDDASSRAIAATVVRLYVSQGNDFTALHAVTGTHAYRMLEPFVTDRRAGRRYLWQALVAAYVTIGAPPVTVPKVTPKLPPWTAVLARAAASNDEHELKFTDVAREEARHHGDGIYLHAAAMALSLTPA